jgi:hypothetical protein
MAWSMGMWYIEQDYNRAFYALARKLGKVRPAEVGRGLEEPQNGMGE